MATFHESYQDDRIIKSVICKGNLRLYVSSVILLFLFLQVQLTLFLKELGLPVHEALLLWKREYSTPVTNASASCHHGWHGNERRYIYNIRHLYGLEGNRVNYKAHSCSTIQVCC